MSYGHAVLGESPELYKEAIEWGKNEQKMIEKNERARMLILKELAPMVQEKNRLIAEKEFEKKI